MILPAMLHTCSDGADEAVMHNSLKAREHRDGICVLCAFHHCKGLLLLLVVEVGSSCMVCFLFDVCYLNLCKELVVVMSDEKGGVKGG